MEFKAFLFCLAALVVTASGATTCKCGAEEKDPIAKYTVSVDDGKEKYDETIKVDTEKKTESFHIPKTSSSPEVDVVYDFKRNLAMHRISSAKACFLSYSTEELPQPDDLVKLLDKDTSKGPQKAKANSSEYEYEVVGTLDDRSSLSDEMADLCSKLPIYRVKPKSLVLDVEKQDTKRVKRGICYTCYRRCYINYLGRIYCRYICFFYYCV